MEQIEETLFNELQLFAIDDVTVEDLQESGALGSFASAGTFASTIGSCASSASTASTFS